MVGNATLPPLAYAYNALEPYISEKIMTLHHTKHHQGYVTALNTAETNYVKAATPKERIALQAAIKFNGGGHINHTLFWANLAPCASEVPGARGGVLSMGPLREAIEKSFGSLDDLKKEFNQAAVSIQGSGWAWLGYNPKSRLLEVVTTANQDPLLTHAPIFGVDMWEHAFYLQYFNVKAEYVQRIWNVLYFDEAERRYLEASGASKL